MRKKGLYGIQYMVSMQKEVNRIIICHSYRKFSQITGTRPKTLPEDDECDRAVKAIKERSRYFPFATTY